MKKKQVIKCNSAQSDEIIKMTDSNTIYADQKFYERKMDEKIKDPNCSSFPV